MLLGNVELAYIPDHDGGRIAPQVPQSLLTTLPGMESQDAECSGITLRDHVDAVIAAIDSVDPADGKVVLVGHSAARLADDQDKLYTRLSTAYRAGWLKRSEARQQSGGGFGSEEADDVYFTDLAVGQERLNVNLAEPTDRLTASAGPQDGA